MSMSLLAEIERVARILTQVGYWIGMLALLWCMIAISPVVWECIWPSKDSTTRRIWEYEARLERERQEKQAKSESRSKKKREKIKIKE
jgi:hypothetical protein